MNYEHFLITKALVKSLLERADQYKWSVQGLGMLRLYLSQEIRLHIWDSSLQFPNATLIHDHPWDFHSLVVSGEITNIKYNQKDFPVRSDAYRPYLRQKLLCGPGGGLKENPSPTFLVMMRPTRYGPLVSKEFGRSFVCYTQNRTEVHETRALDGTVTLVYRTFNGDRDHANVYIEHDKQWVSAEPRPATAEEVERVVRRALENWFNDK